MIGDATLHRHDWRSNSGDATLYREINSGEATYWHTDKTVVMEHCTDVNSGDAT
jgi:hypothetical protein